MWLGLDVNFQLLVFDLAGWQKGEGGAARSANFAGRIGTFAYALHILHDAEKTHYTHQVSLLGPKRSDGLALAPRIQDHMGHVSRVDSSELWHWYHSQTCPDRESQWIWVNPSLHWRILDETWQDLLVDSLRHSELVPLMVTSLPSSGSFSDSMDTVGIGLHLKQIQCTKLFTESSWWQWCHGIVTSIWPTAGEKAVTIHWGISMHTKNYVLQSGYKSPNTTYVLRLFAILMLKALSLNSFLHTRVTFQL